MGRVWDHPLAPLSMPISSRLWLCIWNCFVFFIFLFGLCTHCFLFVLKRRLPRFIYCAIHVSLSLCGFVSPLCLAPPSAVVFCVMAAIFMASKSFVLPTRFGLLEPATAAIYDHGEDSASALASESNSHLDFVSLG